MFVKVVVSFWRKFEIGMSDRLAFAQPRTPQDPDIILVVEYKNWAALDHLGGKLDQVNAKIEGSIEKANQSEADRAKIRTVLGSDTVQVAVLK